MKRVLLFLGLLISYVGYSQCDSIPEANITFSNINTSSFIVYWTPATGAIQYSIEVENDITGVLNTYFTTSTFYAVSGLLPNTKYNVKVLTICSGGIINQQINARQVTTRAVPVVYTPMTANGYSYKRGAFDSTLHVPYVSDTLLYRGLLRPGAVICYTADSLFYGWNGKKWALMGADVKLNTDSIIAHNTRIISNTQNIATNAADILLRVKYTDSTTRYVTPKQLKDSLSSVTVYKDVSGKISTWFGDSNTFGFGVSNPTQTYTNIVSSFYNMIEINNGISGTTMTADIRRPNSMTQRLREIPNYDNTQGLLSIAYGANDEVLINDTLIYSKGLDTVLKYAINTKGWNSRQILIISPTIHSYDVDSNTVKKYVKAGEDASLRYNTLFFDAYKHIQQNGGYINFIADSVHYNQLGYQTLSNGLTVYLSSNGITSFDTGGNVGIKTGTANVSLGTNSMVESVQSKSTLAIGVNSVKKSTNSYNNIALGLGAMQLDSLSFYNVAIGNRVLQLSQNSFWNIGIGYNSLFFNRTGSSNIALGYRSMFSNTIGSANIGVGAASLELNTTGIFNIGLGADALGYNTTGQSNIGIGAAAGQANSTGFGNLSIGTNAGQFNLRGSNNIALGYNTLNANKADNNLAIGGNALSNSDTATRNIAIGVQALNANKVNDNTAIGYRAIPENTTGQNNVGIGSSVMRKNVTGSNNVALGSAALDSNYNGSSNTALGTLAMRANISGNNNVAIGFQSLFQNNTDNNIAIGGNSLYQSKQTGNIAIGVSSLDSLKTGSSNLAFGKGKGLKNGSYNLFLGNYELPLADSNINNSIYISDGQGNLRQKFDNLGNAVFGANLLAANLSAPTGKVSAIDAEFTNEVKSGIQTTGANVFQKTFQSNYNGVSGTSFSGYFAWYASPNNSLYKDNALYKLRAYDNGSASENDVFTVNGSGSIAINGDLSLINIGKKINIATGSNASIGSGTLSSGTATINTTAVSASSKIFIQYTSCSSCGSTYISAKTAGTSFVVTSTNGSDASTFDWWIVN